MNHLQHESFAARIVLPLAAAAAAAAAEDNAAAESFIGIVLRDISIYSNDKPPLYKCTCYEMVINIAYISPSTT